MNQKKWLLFLLLSSPFYLPLKAQKSAFRNDNPHELRAGIGIYPLELAEWGCEWEDWEWDYYNIANYYQGDRIHSPSINLAYVYRLNYRFSLEANLSYARTDQKFYDLYSDRKVGKENQQYFSIMPVARIHWYTNRLISIYSSAGIGWCIYHKNTNQPEWQQKRTESRMSGTFNYFGITVGKRIYGYAELSAGTTGVFLMGMGYRLNK